MAEEKQLTNEAIRLEMAHTFKQVETLLENHPDLIYSPEAKTQLLALDATFHAKYEKPYSFDGVGIKNAHSDLIGLAKQEVQKQLKMLFGMIDTDEKGNKVGYDNDPDTLAKGEKAFALRIERPWKNVTKAAENTIDEKLEFSLPHIITANATPAKDSIANAFSGTTPFIPRSAIPINDNPNAQAAPSPVKSNLPGLNIADSNTPTPAVKKLEPVKAPVQPVVSTKPIAAEAAKSELPTNPGPLPGSVTPTATVKPEPVATKPTIVAQSAAPADVKPTVQPQPAKPANKSLIAVEVTNDQDAHDRLHNAGKVVDGDKDDGQALLYYANKAGITDKSLNVATTLYSVSTADADKVTAANDQFNKGEITKEQFGSVVSSTIKSSKKYDIAFENLIKEMSQARKDSFMGNAGQSTTAFLNSLHEQGFTSNRLVHALKAHHADGRGNLLESEGTVQYFDAEPSSQMLAALKQAERQIAKTGKVENSTKEKIANFESQLIEPGWLPKKKRFAISKTTRFIINHSTRFFI